MKLAKPPGRRATHVDHVLEKQDMVVGRRPPGFDSATTSTRGRSASSPLFQKEKKKKDDRTGSSAMASGTPGPRRTRAHEARPLRDVCRMHCSCGARCGPGAGIKVVWKQKCKIESILPTSVVLPWFDRRRLAGPNTTAPDWACDSVACMHDRCMSPHLGGVNIKTWRACTRRVSLD